METIELVQVMQGDTLYDIARRCGMTVSDLIVLNRLKEETVVPGQRLRVRKRPVPGESEGGNRAVISDLPLSPNYLTARETFTCRKEAGPHHNHYFLEVPLADRLLVAEMRDGYSGHRGGEHGIGYVGDFRVGLDTGVLSDAGLHPEHARALSRVSRMEGYFDSINAFDRGIFSFGFVQFAGSAEHGGALNRLMGRVKSRQPLLFEKIFQSAGLDYEGGVALVADEEGTWLAVDACWQYIRATPPLYGPFIQAGREPLLALEQIGLAAALFVQPTLEAPLEIPGMPTARFQDLLVTEGSLALAIALSISQGVEGMARLFAHAITRLAYRSGLSPTVGPEGLREADIVQYLAGHAADARVRHRAERLLNGGLPFD